MEQEVWKDIRGYEGKYQISSLGRVRSLFYHNAKGVKRTGFLKYATDGKGYLRCALSRDNILTTFKVHRLVAMAFIPNPNNYPQVNHINGDKQDNRMENLEWCNNSMNQKHAYDCGLNPKHRGHCRKVRVKTYDGTTRDFDTVRDAALFLRVNEETIRRRIRKAKQLKFIRTVPFDVKYI